MNAYTRQDLSVMQAWPLERKIRVTQAKIIEWYHHYGGKVAVSFSGGKDSTVLLDLTRRAFPDICFYACEWIDEIACNISINKIFQRQLAAQTGSRRNT